MEYGVRVVANSKKESGTLLRYGRFEVRVNAPRKESRANKRATLLLLAHLGVSPERVSVIRWHTQSTKVVFVSG